MGTVIQLKNQINNSYFQLKDSVENKLLLVEEKIKLKLSSDVELVQKMTVYLFYSFYYLFSVCLSALSQRKGN